MSGKPDEMKYFEKLNIGTASIGRIKSLIKSNIKNTFNCWEKGFDVPKQTFHIIGPAGVGKTEICFQIAEELTNELNKEFNTILIKCPVISRDDVLAPCPDLRDNIPKFKMLYSDFIPLDKNSYGIFIVDEFGRGDHNLQQLMWQIQNEYKIHQVDLPKGWFVVSLDNPDDQEYSMDIMQDAAGLRRTLHIYSEVSVPDFLNYAIYKKFHATVIEFIQTHPEHLYDFTSQKMGSVYSNPASWERVSNILHGFDMNGGVINHILDIDTLISGLINSNMTRLFIDFIKDKKEIRPRDIFNNYSRVQKEIEKYKIDNDNVRLSKTMTSFMTFLVTSRPEYDDQNVKNISQFLIDLPHDVSAMFLTTIDKYKRDSKEFSYARKLQKEMLKIDEYKMKFYEVMKSLGERAAATK